MTIFRRTTDIVTANLNDLVDRWEDPERMLRQALRDMEATLAVTTAAVAPLDRDREVVGRDARKPASRAGRPVAATRKPGPRRGRPKLARRAIARQLNYETAAATTGRQLAEAHEVNNSLRGRLDLLRDRHAAAR